MLNWLVSGFTRWIIAGVTGALLIAGALAFHKMYFVPRGEAAQWEKSYHDLVKAIEEREVLRQADEDTAEENKATVEKLDAERERALAEDRKGDDPVILDSGDLKRLRDFQNRLLSR